MPLSVARFLRGGVPAAGVVGVVDGSTVDDVKHEGLWALGWVDDKEDLTSKHAQLETWSVHAQTMTI